MSDAKHGKGRGRAPTIAPSKLAGRPISGPEIRIGEASLGRDTLGELEDDLRSPPWPRAPLVTVSYDDVPLDGKKPKKGGAGPTRVQVLPPPRAPMTSAPEIEIGDAALGRDTLALIGGDAFDEHATGTETEPASDALELRTFVVPASSVSPRASDAEKRAFVRDRLAHRLPCAASQVRRIDARLLEPGAVVLRIWCPVE